MRTILAVLLGLRLSAPGPAGPRSLPTSVAQEFYRTANAGRCVGAERFFTSESVRLLNRTLPTEGGFARFCTGRAGRSPLARLTVKEQNISGQRASVILEREYQDGVVARERDELVQEGGQWKLVVGGSPTEAPSKP